MKKYRQLILGLAIAAAALYYTLHNVSMSELAASFESMEPVYIVPSVMIICLGYVFRAYRWQALLGSTRKLDVGGLYSPMMVGYMGNFLPARAAEVLRPYLLSKKYDITFSAAFASVIMERLFDLVMLLVIFVWVFWFEAGAFPAHIEFSGISVQAMAIKFGQICLIATGAFAVFIYLLLFHKEKLLGWVRACTGKLPETWARKFEFLVEEFAVGCEVIKNLKALSRIAGHSLLVWGTNVFAFFPLYFAYGLQQKTFTSLLILTVIVAILITVAPTPGFLGSYNAGILIALHHIMGEAEVKAVSFGMVGWALYASVILIGGCYFILHDHMSLKTLVEVKQDGEVALERAEHHQE